MSLPGGVRKLDTRASVGTDIPHRCRRHPVPVQAGRCAEAHLGCPCRGDANIHEQRSKEISEARAQAADVVDCPECGVATSPLSIVRWGHCRSCRTAQSREIYPLRW